MLCEVGQRDVRAEVVSKRLFRSANLPGCKTSDTCPPRLHAPVARGNVGQQCEHKMLAHEPMMRIGMGKQMEDARVQAVQHRILLRIPGLRGNPVNWRHIVGICKRD